MRLCPIENLFSVWNLLICSIPGARAWNFGTRNFSFDSRKRRKVMIDRGEGGGEGGGDRAFFEKLTDQFLCTSIRCRKIMFDERG